MLQNRTVTLALGVLKKGGPCNTAADAPCGIVKPPFVYPNISSSSGRPTSDITRLLKNSPGVLKKDLNGQLVHPPYVCTLAGPPACTEAMSD